jgi:hypothetical protein
MKKYILSALLCLITLFVFSQENSEKRIAIKFRNASLLPKKVAFISYEPNAIGNGTTIAVLMPFCSKRFRFKIGTKIYLANPEQVNRVMGGKRIDNETPYLIVKKENRKQPLILLSKNYLSVFF